jgi:hypothetical protein
MVLLLLLLLMLVLNSRHIPSPGGQRTGRALLSAEARCRLAKGTYYFTGRGIASSGKTLSLGYFSLGQQRKVTRPALDGRKLWLLFFQSEGNSKMDPIFRWNDGTVQCPRYFATTGKAWKVPGSPPSRG